MKKLLVAALAVSSCCAFAQAKKTNPKLIGFKNDVVACEQRLAKKYADMAVSSAQSGERTRGKLGAEEKADPEFAELSARLDACTKAANEAVANAAASPDSAEMVALKREVEACESRVEKKQGPSAVVAAESGGRAKGRVPTAAHGSPAFKDLSSRLEACGKQAQSLVAAEQGGQRAQELAFFAHGDSEQGRVLLEEEAKQPSRSGASKAVEYYQACVKKLDQAFAASAEARSHSLTRTSGGNITAGKLHEECSAKVAAAEAALKKANAAEAAAGKEKLVALFKKQWPIIQGNFARAKKFQAEKDPLALIEADEALYYYDHDLGLPMHLSEAKRILEYSPELASLELQKGLTAQAFVEKSEALQKQASAERAKLRSQVSAAYASYDKELKKVLKGDRLDIVTRKGRPSWVEGAERISNVREGVKHNAKAGWYRYDASNGCKVTYFFKGNSLSREVREPRGCNP